MYHTRLTVTCISEFSEILMAETAEAGFDTFIETENGFEAYIELENFNHTVLKNILQKYSSITPITFNLDSIPAKNWNEEWERNYKPVVINEQCIIRAEFHKIEKVYPYDIVITPKMSFGTGHHATTHLMVTNQLSINHVNKRVMDVGCGTGVLSIMASKRGALLIEAFDIDTWSIENSKENIRINNCPNIQIRKGKINELLFSDPFDILLANINKNVLLLEMPYYYTYLVKDGLLLISGFYEHDVPDILSRAIKEGFALKHTTTRETWAAVVLEKV